MDIEIGEIYQYFKGNKYKILNIAKHSETLEEMVVYQHLDGEREIWVRPKSMFFDEVEVNGNKTLRFSKVG